MIRPTEIIPYARHQITPEDEAAVLGVLRSKWLTQGPKVEEFEALVAKEARAKYAVAVSSGTAALEIAIGAVHSRDNLRHCITSPISFVATANAAHQAGCRVGFVDVSPTSGWWSPPASQIQSDEPFVAVPVSLGGIAFHPEGKMAVPVIGDAAHSFGAATVGSYEALCFSFHAIKHVACGEGGAIVTNDERLAYNCQIGRDHGRWERACYKPGFNYRMAEVPAALGCSQYARLHQGIERRRQIAAMYDAALANVEGLTLVPHGADSARHLYSILVAPGRRDLIRARLADDGLVGTQIHYPAIHLQPFYRHFYGTKEGDFPGAEEYAASTLSIPMFPSLTDAEVEYVAATVKRVVEECQ